MSRDNETAAVSNHGLLYNSCYIGLHGRTRNVSSVDGSSSATAPHLLYLATSLVRVFDADFWYKYHWHQLLCVQISDYSVWLIVAVTCERYLVVCHPFRASTFCGTPVAPRLVVGLLLVFLGLNSHFFWTVGIVRYCQHGQTHYLCTAAEKNYIALVTVSAN